jgi:SP family general alpha glucoside:H+ symporter-like MFS transporter
VSSPLAVKKANKRIHVDLEAEAGVSVNTAFALGLITSALQLIFVMLSWILTTFFVRRTIYLWGLALNTLLLIVLGVAAS